MTYDQQHPITPPPELQRFWVQVAQHINWDAPVQWMQYLSEKAAEWGANQELEACCEWLRHEYGYGEELASKLRAARRPKPQSLKEQALEALDDVSKMSETLYSSYDPPEEIYSDQVDIIRRALEALPDDL